MSSKDLKIRALPHVVVMGFDEAGRVAYEHIYWDQATLLVQVGLLDAAVAVDGIARQWKNSIRPAARSGIEHASVSL
jgi:hypothetical protein